MKSKKNRAGKVCVYSDAIGLNAYWVDFQTCLPLEEDVPADRSRPDAAVYFPAVSDGDTEALWLVPFTAGDRRMENLWNIMETVQTQRLYEEGIFWPFDFVWWGEKEQTSRGYLIRPIQRESCIPVRKFLPDANAPRWDLAKSVFQRLKTLHGSGLTLNGFHREQIRVYEDPFTQKSQICLWPGETVSAIGDSGGEDCRPVLRDGFFTIPKATQEVCESQGLTVTGPMRDIFSAAVLAFYLLFYSHPFVGKAYWILLREDYGVQYQHNPQYIMKKDSENDPGNQRFGSIIREQWSRTHPDLRALFDGLFLAIEEPERGLCRRGAAIWDLDRWLMALEADAGVNDGEISRSNYRFENERNHLV